MKTPLARSRTVVLALLPALLFCLVGECSPPLVQASSIQHRVELKPIARNYMETGEYQKALLLLERWHDTSPEDMEALFYLSQALFETGNLEGSRQALEKLRLLAPNSSWTKAAALWEAEHPTLAMNPLHLKQNMALVSVALSPSSPVSFTETGVIPLGNQADSNIAPINTPQHDVFQTAYAPEAPVASPAFIRYGSEPQAPVVVAPRNTLPEPLPLFKEATLQRSQVQGLQTPVPPAINTQRLEPQPKPAGGRSTPPTTPYTKVMAEPNATTSTASVASPNTVAPPTQEELARNMQTLQQMMMMQMMANMSGNSAGAGANPYAALMGGGGGANAGMMSNMPMMMQMMQAQQGGGMGTMPGGINPAMYSQMMQSSMLNNMNDMFNSSNKDDNDDNGFGF
jgi:hypothetical protein